MERITNLQESYNDIWELIISTNPPLEGKATVHYWMDLFRDRVPVITRIAGSITGRREFGIRGFKRPYKGIWKNPH